MRIVFVPATMRQSKRGSVTAVVYFEFGEGRQFPVAGWNDFVVVITGWWLSALAQMADTSGDIEFRFMDGPYYITARSLGGSRVLIRCIEDRRGAGVLLEVEVGSDELTREVRRLAVDVATACADAGIESPDLTELRRHSLS